jgi:hypothetical protein
MVTTILPFPVQQVGGVSVSAGRLNADTIDDIIVASGRGGGSLTRIYNGRVDQTAPAALVSAAAFAARARPNAPVFRAPIDLDGDGRVDRLYGTQGDAGGSQGGQHLRALGLGDRDQPHPGGIPAGLGASGDDLGAHRGDISGDKLSS